MERPSIPNAILSKLMSLRNASAASAAKSLADFAWAAALSAETTSENSCTLVIFFSKHPDKQRQAVEKRIGLKGKADKGAVYRNDRYKCTGYDQYTCTRSAVKEESFSASRRKPWQSHCSQHFSGTRHPFPRNAKQAGMHHRARTEVEMAQNRARLFQARL